MKRSLSLADPIRESPIESLSYGHMVEAGLPLPTCQCEVRTPQGTLFPDFYWEERRLIGESDGRWKYVDSGAVMHEKEREQVLRDLGCDFLQGFRYRRPELPAAINHLGSGGC